MAHAQDVEVDDVEEARASAPTTSMHVAVQATPPLVDLPEHDKGQEVKTHSAPTLPPMSLAFASASPCSATPRRMRKVAPVKA